MHCRIGPDSLWLHDSDAWDDVHDAQHGVRATVDPGLTAVASGVEGCRCERFGSSCRRPSGIGPWWTTSIGSSEMWTNICDTFGLGRMGPEHDDGVCGVAGPLFAVVCEDGAGLADRR